MTSVTVHEFSRHPAAVFARAERGEVVEVTRDGTVIAVLTPRPRSHYESLIAEGLVIPAAKQLKAGHWDRFTHITIPDGVDPLAVLEESGNDRDLFGPVDDPGERP